jgi:hypothetical protein
MVSSIRVCVQTVSDYSTRQRENLYTLIIYSRCGEGKVRHSGDSSTGNLNKHVKACFPDADLKPQQTMMQTTFANGSTYTREKARSLLAIWVTRCRRPFSIVEDEEFVTFARMLNGRVELPSRASITRDIKSLHVLT